MWGNPLHMMRTGICRRQAGLSGTGGWPFERQLLLAFYPGSPSATGGSCQKPRAIAPAGAPGTWWNRSVRNFGSRAESFSSLSYESKPSALAWRLQRCVASPRTTESSSNGASEAFYVGSRTDHSSASLTLFPGIDALPHRDLLVKQPCHSLDLLAAIFLVVLGAPAFRSVEIHPQ